MNKEDLMKLTKDKIATLFINYVEGTQPKYEKTDYEKEYFKMAKYKDKYDNLVYINAEKDEKIKRLEEDCEQLSRSICNLQFEYNEALERIKELENQ